MNQSDNNPTPNNKPLSHNAITSKKTIVSRWLLPILLVMIVAGGGFFILSHQQKADPPSRNNESLRAIGPETAPIIISEYADFGCISCKAWHQFGIREEIIKQYGDQVRFVWHDFPVTTAASPKAAEAGFCAHDQGQFWAYHDIVFANAPRLSIDDLKTYAAQIGLDIQQFNQCLESGKHQAAVEAELNAALNQGFRSVPSFMVNDIRLIGPPSFEQLSATIDKIFQSME